MKKLLLLPALLFSFWNHGSALDASVSFCTFQSPDQTYFEVYFHFFGKTINFDTLATGELQAGVEVFIMVKKAEEEIVLVDKYNLHSPKFTVRKDFLDLKRYSLGNGEYTLFIKVTDLQDPDNNTQFETPFFISYDKSSPALSDIQLVASLKKAENQENVFVKSGFELEPQAYNFYNKNTKALLLYHELYNTEYLTSGSLKVNYTVFKKVNNEEKEFLSKSKTIRPSKIYPVVQSLNIEKIPSGNYLLKVELVEESGNILDKKAIVFQRSNPDYDESVEDTGESTDDFFAALSPEDMEYSLRAIAPLLEDQADFINSLIAAGVKKSQQMYLSSYWKKRAPKETRDAYEKYMQVARAVDQQFQSGFGHGFETDRGYVYLKYGRPDDIISVDDEPSAPPYEIWSYNYFPQTNQGNVRFLFYNPSLSPGNFTLLHSNARGERSNPQWQLELYRDAPNEIDGGNYIDGTEMQDNFGRRAARYFNDF
jgi:GWxTD domain-containing protein